MIFLFLLCYNFTINDLFLILNEGIDVYNSLNNVVLIFIYFVFV